MTVAVGIDIDISGTKIAAGLVDHTADTVGAVRPAIDLTAELATLGVPVIVEGGSWDPQHVRDAFGAGAWAVVVGAAITAPDLITARLVEAARQAALAHHRASARRERAAPGRSGFHATGGCVPPTLQGRLGRHRYRPGLQAGGTRRQAQGRPQGIVEADTTSTRR